MKKLLITIKILIILISFNSEIFAQTEIYGKVLDENGRGISNFVLKVEDIEISTVTDIEGNFKLWLPEKPDKLEFSNYQEYEITNIEYISDNQLNVICKSIFDLTLEELMNIKVVTATGNSENINTAPATIYAISSQQIAEKGYTNLLELLKDQPAFDFDIQHGGWVSQVAYLRGTRSNSILIMLDGVVQNNINEGEMDKYHTIGLANISRVEIITGPATALYGPNALVGVINLITKTAAEINGVQVSGGYTSSIGDEILAFDKYNLNAIFGKELKNGFGIMGSFNTILNNDQGFDYYDPDNFFVKGHIKYDDPIADDGFSNRQNDYISTLRLTKDKNFTFGIDYADINEGLGTMFTGSWRFLNNDSIDNRWHTRRISAFTEINFNITDKIKFTPKLYFRNDQVVDDSRFALTYGKNLGVYRSFKQQTYRNGVDLKIKYQILQNLNFLGGFVYEDSQMADEASKYAATFDNFDNTIDENEPFIYDTYEIIEDELGNITDTIFIEDTLFYQNNSQIRYLKQYSFYSQLVYDMNKNLKFILGGRYYKETEIDGVFTPRAGLVFNTSKLLFANDQLIIKLMYGQAFKALANDEKNLLISLEKDLLPAKGTTYEFSSIYLPNKISKIEITGWYNSIENYFVYGTPCKEDIINQETYGIQSVGQVTIGSFVLGANYTFTDGKNIGQWYQDKGYALPDSTPYENLIRVSTHKVNASLSYLYKKYFSINLKMKFVGDRFVAPVNLKYGANEGFFVPRNYDGEFVFPEDDYSWAGTGTMPGYTIFDLNIGTSDLGNAVSFLRGTSIYFQISNILNTKYLETAYSDSRTYPPYNPQPGRRFTLNLRYLIPL